MAAKPPAVEMRAEDRPVSVDLLFQGGQNLFPSDAVAAIIVVEDGRYLMQQRDEKPNIFYPGHWGVFGGAIDGDEKPTEALRRELREELNLVDFEPRYFTRTIMDFGFGGNELGDIIRLYYEVRITVEALATLTLGEGRDMRAFYPVEIARSPQIVPYDSVAIWMHASRDRITFHPREVDRRGCALGAANSGEVR